MLGTIHPKNWSSRGIHTLLRPRRNSWPCAYTNALGMPNRWSSISLQLLQDHFHSQNRLWQEPWIRYVTGNSSWRTGMTWSNCHDPSSNSKALMHISGNSGSTALKVKLAGSRSSTSSLLIKTKRQLTVNGLEREEEDEERKAPTTREQLKRAHTVFRNSLLMCIISFPQFAHFDAKYQDLEEWYSFFWGKDIADRKPQPSEMVLLYAERNAWRDIHNRVYEGATLKEAMTAQKANTLFWQREVYERLSKPDKGSGQPKGSGGQNPKGKGKVRPSWSPFQPQWSKGKQPQKGKSSKGSSKGKDNNWPKNWATQTPKGCNFAGIFFSGTSAQGTVADPMDARLLRMGGPAMAPTTRTSAQTNEKGGWPSSKRPSPPFRQTHLQRWNRSHTTTPLGDRPLLRGARNTHGGTNPNLSNTTPNNLKLVVWRSVLLRILLTTTLFPHNVQP